MNLFDVTTYSTCLVTLIGIFLLDGIHSKKIRIFIYFQVLSCICDIFLIYIIPMNDGHFVRLFYCFLRPLEYLVYVYLLLDFKSDALIGKYAISSSILMFCFSLYQLAFRLGKYDLTDQLMLLEGIFTIAVSLFYFQTMLSIKSYDKTSFGNFWKDPKFWIATGLLFFFAGNVIVTGFYHRLWNHSESLVKLWYTYTNLVLGIVQSILFVIAYVAATRKNYLVWPS